MNKIELYKRVILTQDYEEVYTDNKHEYFHEVFKKGTIGIAIDELKDGKFIMVELEDKNYNNTLPCFPVELLEYYNAK